MHNYGNIENESALVTSQFHIGDSPKAIIEFSHSERLETLNKQGKRHSIEGQSLIEMASMHLNNHLLPSISLNCHSLAVFAQIITECKQYHYRCILNQPHHLLFLYIGVDSFPQKVCRNICPPTYIPSQSNNAIISVKYSNQKIQIDALSGNYKMNEDVVLAISSIVRRYNQNHKDYEVVDDLNHSNPYGITALSVNNVYNQLKDNNIFQLRLNRILTSIDQLTKPTKQQLQQYLYEGSQLCLETLQQFKENIKKLYHPYYMLALEKATFESINQNIFHFYVEIYQKKEEQFNNKKNLIENQYTPESIMEFLEIKQKYRLYDQYWIGVNELNKIDKVSNPRDKLKCIQQMLSMVKSVVYESCNEELLTMDDELPVMIYIILVSTFSDKYAQISIVDDFCNTDPTIENEKRTVTTLKVSLDYISTEWQV